jgi:hypothetical protein
LENRRDEPICVIIHKNMEMSQRNSLFSYLKQKYHFVFTKLENRRAGLVLSKVLVPVGGERMWGKGVGG